MRTFLVFLTVALSLSAVKGATKITRHSAVAPTFEENLGQAGRDVLFLARDARGRMEITRTGVDFRLASATHSATVPLRFPGAAPGEVQGMDRAGNVTHLLLGNDPKAWKRNIPNYRRAVRRNVFPGIDLIFHGSRGLVEFDFILAPGANPSLPALAFPGYHAEIAPDGGIAVATAASVLHFAAPVAYQDLATGRRNVDVRFERRANGTIGFRLGHYDRSQPLVIDPTINYMSYFGGSGSELQNTMALDSAGNFYLAGQTNSANLPVTNGAAQSLRRGSSDAYIAKFNPNGNLVYTTLLGGEQADEINAISVDSQGSVYFGGVSLSTNFPLANAYLSQKRSDATSIIGVFGKLNPTGSALVYSSYLGGEYADEIADVTIDAAGNLYLTGSAVSDQFPTTAGAYQVQNNGVSNAFVTKVSPGGDRLVFSTFLGGELLDEAYSIALAPDGGIFVGGATGSRTFPVRNPLQPTKKAGGAGLDGFITKLNASGSGLVYSTFLGGNGDDSVQAVAVGTDGSVVAAGSTTSADLPLGPSPLQRTLGGARDMFVHKLTPAGDGITYGTLFGGSGEERSTAVQLDAAGAAYVAVYTTSLSLRTVNAQQPEAGGGGDAFYMKVSPAGNELQMASYFGSNGTDTITDMVVDATGKIYLCGTTGSSRLPISSGAQQRNLAGGNDAFIAIIEPDRNTGDAGSLLLSNSRLTFTGLPGAAIPRQTFNISPVTGNPAWTLDVATLSGGGWLSATPRAASGPATIEVNVNTASLSAGTYVGTITVNNPSVNERQVVNVTLQLGSAPGSVPNNGVVSAATFTGGGISPGLVVTIFGSGIGPATLTSGQIASDGKLASTLAETRVLFDGAPAPLVYVSSSQISAIVPYAVASRITSSLVVEYRGVRTNAVTLTVVDTAPGLFTANSSGRGPGAILNQDNSVNTASNPARPGSVVILYGTGEGITDPVGQDGQLATTVYPKPRQPVTVRIGGREAEVLYAGAAPGLVAGVFQINVKVPDAAADGPQAVVVQIGAAASSPDVTVAVRR